MVAKGRCKHVTEIKRFQSYVSQENVAWHCKLLLAYHTLLSQWIHNETKGPAKLNILSITRFHFFPTSKWKNIARYTEDLVMQRLVKSRFHPW